MKVPRGKGCKLGGALNLPWHTRRQRRLAKKLTNRHIRYEGRAVIAKGSKAEIYFNFCFLPAISYIGKKRNGERVVRLSAIFSLQLSLYQKRMSFTIILAESDMTINFTHPLPLSRGE